MYEASVFCDLKTSKNKLNTLHKNTDRLQNIVPCFVLCHSLTDSSLTESFKIIYKIKLNVMCIC